MRSFCHFLIMQGFTQSFVDILYLVLDNRRPSALGLDYGTFCQRLLASIICCVLNLNLNEKSIISLMNSDLES